MIKIGVQSAYWYSDKNPDACFRYIRECGFDAVDFNIDSKLPGDAIRKGPLTAFFDQSVEELCEYYRPLKEAAEKNGVFISQMHAPFPLWIRDNDAVNDYMITVVEKVCAVCAFVGCPAVVVHPITLPDKEEEIRVNMEMYRRMIPAGKKYGVKLCLENLFTSFRGRLIEGACTDPAEACMYLDTLNAEAGEEIFGFCFDVGHANLTARSIEKYLKCIGKRLTILHIHENDGTGDLHMIPYTHTRSNGKDPNCDWEGFINGLRAIGFEGTLSFETFRVLTNFPKPLHTDALRMISAIGKYFRDRIEAE